MKNADRVAKLVKEKGSNNVLIHTIPNTSAWLLATKEHQQWILTVLDPMQNVSFNIGIVDNSHLLEIWKELTVLKLEKQFSVFEQSKHIKHFIKEFLKENKEFRNYLIIKEN